MMTYLVARLTGLIPLLPMLALLYTSLPARATAQTCIGDCDGDDVVGISELITLVNIALGLRPVGDCAPLGANGAAGVTIARASATEVSLPPA